MESWNELDAANSDTLARLRSSCSTLCCDRGLSASLQNSQLWNLFHGITNEMMVSKRGRRMFPSMLLSFTGLDEASEYYLILEMRCSEERWKFTDGCWRVVSGEYAPQKSAVHVHPSSPATGEEWKKVSFRHVKLHNHDTAGGNSMVLRTFHHYQPVIHLIKRCQLHGAVEMSAFSFEETQFKAVTAYQNELVTKAKIAHNPFAKAFLTSRQEVAEKRPAAPSVAAAATTPTIDYQYSQYAASINQRPTQAYQQQATTFLPQHSQTTPPVQTASFAQFSQRMLPFQMQPSPVAPPFTLWNTCVPLQH